MSVGSPADRGVRAEIAAREWYHTIELEPGVETPGWFDTRSMPDVVGMPARFDGRRCLDVGTFDGFWAFELERRGAAEVHAIDILDPERWDWPASASQETIAAIGRRKGRGEGFDVAREALGSRVVRHERSIYDLDPEVDGLFDFVYVGSLLLHLRDPVEGLRAVRSVCQGSLLLVDAIDVGLTRALPRRPVAGLDALGRPWWWKPNLAGLVRMVEAAGFELERPPRRFRMPPGAGMERQGLAQTARAIRSPAVRHQFWISRLGDPHAAIHGRPVSA